MQLELLGAFFVLVAFACEVPPVRRTSHMLRLSYIQQ